MTLTPGQQLALDVAATPLDTQAHQATLTLKGNDVAKVDGAVVTATVQATP